MRAILAGILALALAPPALAVDLQGQARVIDGDTIEVAGQQVRLHGIDAPEKRQPRVRDGREWACGRAAADALRALVRAHPVSCEGLGVDRYGRVVGRCLAGGRDVGEEMVRRGRELAYRTYSRDYVGQEEAARAGGLGVWAGEFAAPWDWRRTGDGG